jgi:hypothetical protein
MQPEWNASAYRGPKPLGDNKFMLTSGLGEESTVNVRCGGTLPLL